MTPTQNRIDSIIRTACELFGVDIGATLQKKHPGKELYNARIIAIRAIRDSTSLTLVAIGNIFETDHSCIVRALQAYDRYRQSDTFFRIDADFFKTQISL